MSGYHCALLNKIEIIKPFEALQAGLLIQGDGGGTQSICLEEIHTHTYMCGIFFLFQNKFLTATQ